MFKFQASAFVLFVPLLFSLVITFSAQSVFGYPRPEKIDKVSPPSTASPPLPERSSHDEDHLIQLISTVEGEVPEIISCPSYKDTRTGSTIFLNDYHNASGHRVRKEILVASMYDAIEVVRICLMHMISQGRNYFHNVFAHDRYQGIDVTDFFLPFQAVNAQPKDFSIDEDESPLPRYETETSTEPTVPERNVESKEESSNKQGNPVENDFNNQTSPKEES
ncbi:unnamed protein product [Orchesella dallaii]|uniref:Uncharacterized protein n=1 Tax=Orchesella dallaii TaxID=48710 RepID=A0ABP1PYF4_9HEXA